MLLHHGKNANACFKNVLCNRNCSLARNTLRKSLYVCNLFVDDGNTDRQIHRQTATVTITEQTAAESTDADRRGEAQTHGSASPARFR